jgi:hypothetical protein
MAKAAWFVGVGAMLAACKQPTDKTPGPATGGSASPQASAVQDASAGADAALHDASSAASDAAPSDGAIDLGAAVWPSSIVSSVDETSKTVGEFHIDIALPRFRTTPDAIGKELDAKLAPLAELGLDPKKHQGSLSLTCTRLVVNRLVAIVQCGRMFDARTLAEARAGTGGAPGGPSPIVVAVWLQPGLPPIRLDEIAPGVDGAATIAAAQKSHACADDCTYKPDRFVIDEEGRVRFVPIEHCDYECATEHAPRIALDAIKPTHLWGKKLYAWIHERLDADESLVK